MSEERFPFHLPSGESLPNQSLTVAIVSGIAVPCDDSTPSTEEQTLPNIEQSTPELLFDSTEVTLEGLYYDEISAHRARRNWLKAFELGFMLTNKQDISLRVEWLETANRFRLRCCFNSACARYAFWRLTNNQVPEVQELIETAHIPNLITHITKRSAALPRDLRLPLLTRLFRRITQKCGWLN
jgi:hypothetical protein